MITEIIQKHPTLPVMCNAVTGEVCRTTGKHAWQWTKGSLHPKGYYRLRVEKKTIWVHRLIAETFMENPCKKPTIDHINRIKTDNRLLNLRFATMLEQSKNTSRKIADYGVKRSENPKEYYKAYDRVHAERKREWRRYHNWVKKINKAMNW